MFIIYLALLVHRTSWFASKEVMQKQYVNNTTRIFPPVRSSYLNASEGRGIVLLLFKTTASDVDKIYVSDERDSNWLFHSTFSITSAYCNNFFKFLCLCI